MWFNFPLIFWVIMSSTCTMMYHDNFYQIRISRNFVLLLPQILSSYHDHSIVSFSHNKACQNFDMWDGFKTRKQIWLNRKWSHISTRSPNLAHMFSKITSCEQTSFEFICKLGGLLKTGCESISQQQHQKYYISLGTSTVCFSGFWCSSITQEWSQKVPGLLIVACRYIFALFLHIDKWLQQTGEFPYKCRSSGPSKPYIYQ